MASSKDAASLVLLGLYGFIALRLLLTWLQRRRQRRSPLLVGPDNRRRSRPFPLSVMQVLHGALDSVTFALSGALVLVIFCRTFYLASVGALCSTASDGSSRRGSDARIGLVCR